MSKKLYFAYGTNLDFDIMKNRCPEAKKIAPAKLNNHKLTKALSGVANIEYSESDTVDGVIYEISDNDLRLLDMYEGYPFVYGRKRVKIEESNQTYRCQVYFVQETLLEPIH